MSPYPIQYHRASRALMRPVPNENHTPHRKSASFARSKHEIPASRNRIEKRERHRGLPPALKHGYGRRDDPSDLRHHGRAEGLLRAIASKGVMVGAGADGSG